MERTRLTFGSMGSIGPGLSALLLATALSPSIARANPPHWSPVALLNSNGTINDSPNTLPRITTDRTGNWVTVWHSTGVLRTGLSDILISRSMTNGMSWSLTGPLNTMAGSGNGTNEAAHVETDGRGTWIAVWHSTNTFGGMLGGNFHIWVSRSTNNGVTWTAPRPLSPNAMAQVGINVNPRVVTDRNNNWIAVWISNETSTGGSLPPNPKFNAVYSVSTDNGMTWGVAGALDTRAATNTGSGFNPDLATDRAGNWLAVWETTEPRLGATASARDIVFARSTDNGTTWSPAAAANNDPPGDTANDFEPRIVTDAMGTWVVVWYANNIGGPWGNDYDACVVRSTNNGMTWSNRAPLNSDAYVDRPEQADQRPFLIQDGTNWVAVWDKVTGNYRDIMTATSTTGARTWSTLAALNSNAGLSNGDAVQAAVAADGRGHLVAVWRSNDTLFGTVPHQHFNIFTSNGTYVCGDGHLDPGEDCDNGPPGPGNCCSATCTIIAGCGVDAGPRDATNPDAPSDGGTGDRVAPDAPAGDAPSRDAPGAEPVEGPGDAETPIDAVALPDATGGVDAGGRVNPDATTPPPSGSGNGGGCSCSLSGVASSGGGGHSAAISIALLILWIRGRKARSRKG